MTLHTINTGLFKLDGGAMHGVVPKSMWQKANPSDDNNMCTWAMRCLLIETDNKLILVDTGMGNKQDDKFFSYYYPHGDDSLQKSIESKGYSMQDVTDVFLTHLHFDHCGGAIVRDGDKLVPAFANAKYWSHQMHWKSAIQPNAREKASFLEENILPIQESGQLYFYEAHEKPLGESFDLKIVQGHTDSMMLPLINYKGTSILYCADLMPSLAHISLPWVMAYDMRPLDTLTEKEMILKDAASRNWVLMFEHDSIHECCNLQATERGIRHNDVFRLDEI